jgi:hypothetical protein
MAPPEVTPQKVGGQRDFLKELPPTPVEPQYLCPMAALCLLVPYRKGPFGLHRVDYLRYRCRGSTQNPTCDLTESPHTQMRNNSIRLDVAMA